MSSIRNIVALMANTVLNTRRWRAGMSEAISQQSFILHRIACPGRHASRDRLRDPVGSQAAPAQVTRDAIPRTGSVP
jgi:hypothetical protein